MYISAETIAELEKKFGQPEELSLDYEMTDRELGVVRGSQKHGRAHDVTMFIISGDRVVVIKKPMYPPGAYRAPSGGIAPGEPFEEGALREAYEETGLVVSLEKYIVRANVRFSHGLDAINWTSHVFTASSEGTELNPIDTHEIAEARFVNVDELMGSIRNELLASGSTGLRYRSELNDFVINKLIEDGVIDARR
jgi:8-oxo-dGTP pyrophosphatase MutT (NUDIX family)